MSANNLLLPNQISSSCEALATKNHNVSQMWSSYMLFVSGNHGAAMILYVRLHTVMHVLPSHVLSPLLPFSSLFYACVW